VTEKISYKPVNAVDPTPVSLSLLSAHKVKLLRVMDDIALPGEDVRMRRLVVQVLEMSLSKS
jgi:hypothetical protein